MARLIHSRFKICGTLITKTPLHIGGISSNADTDLALAIDGQGKYYVPGTSLAGAFRAWMADFSNLNNGIIDSLWGFQPQNSKDKAKGYASFIIVEDAVVNLKGAIPEIRDGVGIDRCWGTAADGQKYNRAILPRGSTIELNLTLERSAPQEETNWEQQKMLFFLLLKSLEQGKVRLGAAKTRGLGKVKLYEPKVLEQKFLDTQEFLTTLKQQNNPELYLKEWKYLDKSQLKPNLEHAQNRLINTTPSQLELKIKWKPCTPVMVKAEGEGVTVDILPLVNAVENSLTFVIPGSSIKGAMRSQAERIVRTVCQQSTPEDFLTQVQVELVKTIFGNAAKVGKDKKQQGYLGALAIDDCYATVPISPQEWAEIETATDSEKLRKALDNNKSNLSNTQQAFHVAIDRWTGGAADGALYSVLEPMGVSWEPMHLTLNLNRLDKKEVQNDHEKEPKSDGIFLPRLALMFLVFRDLMQQRIPIGFGTNRGMGVIEVEKISIQGKGELGDLEALRNVSLTKENFSGLDNNFLDSLNQEWQKWIDLQEKAHE